MLYEQGYSKQECLQKTNLWLPEVKRGMRRINSEFEINRYTHIKQISNKFLLYSTGNYIQYFVTNYNGKECEKECVYMYD